MTSAIGLITERVRERVRSEGVDLAGDDALAARLVRDEVQRYSEHALGGSQPLLSDEEAVTRQVVAALTGFGPLQPYLDDPSVEELWINGPQQVFVAREGVSERIELDLTESQVRELVERMLHSTGRRVDLSSPFVDAALPDGSRLHVVIPDITRAHWAVNVRKFRRGIRDLRELTRLGSLTQQAAEFLHLCVRSGQNILVSGATQSGKTTLLGALLASARPEERVVTVEETFELFVSGPDWVAMQCRQPSLEGTGEITLRRLIKEALRMRPDRLVVGEVREAESLDLLIALNSGLPGMCSIHANHARDALAKLSTLPLLAGRNIDSGFVVPTVASAIDVVAHAELERGGRRRVVEIVATTGRVVDGVPEATPLFSLERGVLTASGELPERADKFRRAGIDPAVILRAGSRSVVTLAVGLLLGAGLVLAISPWVWPRSAASGARRASPLDGLRVRLRQAGMPQVSAAVFVIVSVLLGVAVLALVSVLTPVLALAVVVGVVAGMLPLALLTTRARVRRRALRAAWPDLVDHLVSGLRSGLPLAESVGALAAVGAPETRDAFVQFEREVRASGTVSAALDGLKERLADPVADRIVETLRMAREVGGTELPTVLRNLAASLRAELVVRAEAEARQSWVVSAARLGVAAPWVVLLLLASRPEAASAYNSPLGLVVLGVGLVVTIVAYRLMIALGRLPEERRWFA